MLNWIAIHAKKPGLRAESGAFQPRLIWPMKSEFWRVVTSQGSDFDRSLLLFIYSKYQGPAVLTYLHFQLTCLRDVRKTVPRSVRGRPSSSAIAIRSLWHTSSASRSRCAGRWIIRAGLEARSARRTGVEAFAWCVHWRFQRWVRKSFSAPKRVQ